MEEQKVERKVQILARFPETARDLAGAPKNASVRMIESAYDRDPYGFKHDDRDLYEVVWYAMEEQGVERKIKILARFPETARDLAGAPKNASVRMIESAGDRDPYGFGYDDRDLYEVMWYA